MNKILDELSSAMDAANIHTDHDGYIGNCGNVAIALYEIALEDYNTDAFRFAVFDRPSHFGSEIDHIAIKYDGKYLDSDGIHSYSELIDSVSNEEGEMGQAQVQVESKSFVTDVFQHYDEERKDELKSLIRNNL